MKSWFDRRHCIICTHAPTTLANDKVSDEYLSKMFEDPTPSNSNPSLSPSTSHNHSHSRNSHNHTDEQSQITIQLGNNALTLSMPSLTDVQQQQQQQSEPTVSDVPSPPSDPPPPPAVAAIQPGTGATYKCGQCFARVHLDCLERHHGRTHTRDSAIILCPICTDSASTRTQQHYTRLECSIVEEQNLLRDWSETECLACGDVGQLICCDVCFYESGSAAHNLSLILSNESTTISTRQQKKRADALQKQVSDDTRGLFVSGHRKLDCAAQFHARCVIPLNTDFIDDIAVPEPWICPLCTTEYGTNRLQALHFFQRKRTKAREHRMQVKAIKAQQFCTLIGFEVDEIRKCVFCRCEGDDTAEGVFFDKQNEFVGPFYVAGDNEPSQLAYWAHYQCVMWAPQVFMNERSEFCNVETEIKRGRHLTCSVCTKAGAVLGCYEKGCHNTYHLPCAQEAKCYFDRDLYAIYCPSHYFVHFLAQPVIAENIDKRLIATQRVYGLNGDVFEKCRFDAVIARKRKIAKSCRATDFCDRYRSAVDVWQFMMRQSHAHSLSSSASHSNSQAVSKSVSLETNPNVNHCYLTRAKKRQLELHQRRRTEQQKKRYKRSLLSIGGRKRSRACLDGNLVTSVHTRDDEEVSPHECKRRRVFGLQPKLLNDETVDVAIEPDKIDIFEQGDAGCDMSSMVGGSQHAISVLKETVLLPLLYPDLFASLRVTPAKGVILYGPPGTGKTLLVRSLIRYYYTLSRAAFASSSNSNTPAASPERPRSITIASPSPQQHKNPRTRYNSLADAVRVEHHNLQQQEAHQHESLISFFSRRGPDLLSKFHGETERNLRSLFKRAQECAPSIIFFDEIDGLCPIRSPKQEQVHNSVVATLLSLMDGLHATSSDRRQSEQVYVIAATNRIDNVDAALRRPGRFDREIYVGLPSAPQRLQILEIHTKNWHSSAYIAAEHATAFEEYLRHIATHKTNGCSGADLKSLCTETFLNAIHRCCPNLYGRNEGGGANMGGAVYSAEVAGALQRDVEVETGDFEKTFRDGFKASSLRNDDGGGGTAFAFDASHSQNLMDVLSADAKQTLDAILQRLEIYINRSRHGGMDADNSVPARREECTALDDDDASSQTQSPYVRSVRQARVISRHNDRIVLCGSNSSTVKWIVSYLLHTLDISNVQHVTIPMVSAVASAYNGREDLYHCVLSKIKSAIQDSIGVIVVHDLDIWMEAYPKLTEAMLLSNINDMCQERNTLLLCTCNKKWNATNCWESGWSHAVYQYFASFEHHFYVEE